MAASLRSNFVADLIGAPFVPGGNGPGYDCYSLVREVSRRMGHPLPPYDYEAVMVDNIRVMGDLITEVIGSGTWQPCGPEPGAVVAIRNAPGIVNHVGIVVEPGIMMHILKRVGAFLVPLDSPAWRHRIEGFYAWKPQL